MKWLFRPSILLAASAALVVGAAVLMFHGAPPLNRPEPLPVGADEAEVVWLYGAVNASSWERFVAAVQRTADQMKDGHPGLSCPVTEATFPRQTTAVPELAVTLPASSGARSRLVFRWYKLTSERKIRDWVEALMSRQPPPLAIIGGNSSDAARELATQLNRRAARLPAAAPPRLLLTTPPPDRVEPGAEWRAAQAQAPSIDGPVPLERLYPGRTFRFCFTNRQMASAVTRFIWDRDDLRPDTDPIHLVRWDDDSYSRDLIDGFWEALRRPLTWDTARDWAWVSGCVANSGLGGPPPVPLAGGAFPTHRAGLLGTRFQMRILPTPQFIDSSVGSFESPNRFEARAAADLVVNLERDPEQRRPLLVVSGQSQPSRRFLRALARAAPALAHRFVVATGDALSFNNVYRDRQVFWHIQDLPFKLVFFCHHNPIDEAAGFRPASASGPERPDELGRTATTGTEDVLLYGDIVEALVLAAEGGSGPADAAAVGSRLLQVRRADGRLTFETHGQPFFDADGNRRSATGEHVVCVRPLYRGERVLPQATIEVSALEPEGLRRTFRDYGEPLRVQYDDATPEGP
jgi:hypothetical protein